MRPVEPPRRTTIWVSAFISFVLKAMVSLNAVHVIQSAGTPRGEAIRAAKRRLGRGPALWLSSLLVCSECGSNYVQYGRTDYV